MTSKPRSVFNSLLLVLLSTLPIACGKKASTATPGATATSTGSGSTTKTIFVTSQAYAGNFGGLAGADAACTAAAAGAGLRGNYVAWLSDSTTDAISRITLGSKFVDTTGQTVFNGITGSGAGFLNTTPLVDIAFDETGSAASSSPWTGSNIGGVKDSFGNYCGDWASNAASGVAGTTSLTTTSWINGGFQSCNSGNTNSLICIRQ